jgi:hypothetical protein
LPAAVYLLFAAAARADEWALEPSISARMVHNDNINMRPSDALAATSLALTPSLTLANRTETRDASASLSTTVNRYAGLPAYNTIDHRASLSLKSATELDQRSLTLASVRDSTLTSELAATGIVLARRQRTQTSAQASWQHSLSETTFANAALSLTSVKYEPAPGIVDYDDRSVSAGLRRALSERLTLGTTFATRVFQTTTGTVKSNVDSIAIDGALKYSERLSFNLDASRNQTRTQLQRTGLACPPEYGFISNGTITVPVCVIVPSLYQTVVVPTTSEAGSNSFSGTASYQLQSASLSSSLSRSLNPSGTGALLRSDQVSLNYQRRFSESLDFSFVAGIVRSSVLDSAGAESRYNRLAPSVQWRLDQWTSLSCGYVWSSQDAAGQERPARSNMLFVGLNYGFRPLSVSR